MAVLSFPPRFAWGVATASYQIEGSPLADGAGASIWHTFAHTPGTISNGETGDVACDHYRRMPEDVGLMRELGIRAYRFSVSWPRVFARGRAPVNEKGMAFYERLVDALLEAGIEPMATLYHWDLPQALEDEGGWPERSTSEHYADYAEAMFSRLGDRVSRWITFNEPWVFNWLGYGLGIHAPGRSDPAAALRAGHHTLLAHGMAVERLRQLQPSAQIGITLSVQAHVAAGSDPRDIEAVAKPRAFHNEWFADPIVFGRYPQPMLEQFAEAMPEMTDADRRVVQRPIDFLGLNYYTRTLHRHDPGGFFGVATCRALGEHTAMDWEVYPAGLYLVLRQFHERYGLPLYVTENGAGFEHETVEPDGSVHDTTRLRYLQSHLEMCQRAIAEGVDLRGYFAWSLMDNFEWAFGYAKRFGIVRCDFETQRRTPKWSALWYRRVIEENGI